jgi:hypothetical protein
VLYDAAVIVYSVAVIVYGMAVIVYGVAVIVYGVATIVYGVQRMFPDQILRIVQLIPTFDVVKNGTEAR